MAPATMLARKKVSKKTRKPWEGFWTHEQKKPALRKGRMLELLKKNNIPVNSVLGKHLINLTSNDLGIRGSAITELEKIAPFKPLKPIFRKVVLPTLKKSLNDPELVIREEAEKAINRIKRAVA